MVKTFDQDFDMTTHIEEVAKEEAQTLADLITAELASVRPVGSTKVPEDEQRLEFELMQDNPELLLKFFTDQNASVAGAIKYSHQMLRRNPATRGKEK